MKYSYEDLAGMIDHALLHPALTDVDLRAGCALAVKYGVASVCIQPAAVPLAVEALRGSRVAVGTVVGFPHGTVPTCIKRAEAAEACRAGATEIDMVINIGKALGGDWAFVEEEIRVVLDEVRQHGALLKVIFETDFITADSAKIRLCAMCLKLGVEYVKTSTGFGFIAQPDGSFRAAGAVPHDITLMCLHAAPKVKVKASGGIRDLDALIRFRDLGVSRCGTTATAQILDEYNRRKGRPSDH